MDQMYRLPSRPLVWAARCLRLLLWLVVSGWVLFGATLAVVHGFIVPRIGDWRPDLENLASRAVGIPVRIGAIQAASSGWIPTFEFSGVRLLDGSGRDALVLNRVLTSVSVASLWRLGFDQIHIDQPTLDVRRRADGVFEVAGFALSGGEAATDEPSALLDWFFAQSEFAIRSGTVRWTDDLRQQPAVTLEQVDLVVRNPGRQHLLRLDATPEGGLAGRINLQGVFRSPLLTLHPGRLSDWRGTAFVDMPAVDLARMASPTQLSDQIGLHVSQGRGALRVWADVDKGRLTHSTADLALTDVNARFSRAAHALQLKHFAGRLTLTHQPEGWAIQTDRIDLETDRGTRWTNGQLRALYQPTMAPSQAPGELDISRFDLAAMQELASALPLPTDLRHWVDELQPTGEIEKLSLKWTGNDETWSSYSAKGQARDLSLRAANLSASPADTPTTPGRPGFSGAHASFELNQHGGKATLGMRQGNLVFPGVFEDPLIPLDSAQADVSWTLKNGDIHVQFSNARFSNADLQGQATGSWRTAPPETSGSGTRFPGILKLDGTLSRGKGARVHRYLPLVIAADARHYVRDAILAGNAHDVRFKVHGDLWHMPFDKSPEGDFRIVAKVSKVDYAFVPTAYTEATALKWPALRQLEGELVFDKASMSLKVSKGLVADAPGLRVGRTSARIADLSHNAVVEIDAQIDGPLQDALSVVRRSPLADMTAHALAQARGSGTAAIQFGLAIPLQRMAHTTVKGSVTLPGNDVQIAPDTPVLVRTRGTVEFTDKGFQVPAATARLVGGELQFAGGMRAADTPVRFRGQGTATAEGLKQAAFLGLGAQLAAHARGSTAYTAQLTLGAAGPDIQVESNLQGLQFNLPAPLDKATGATWPMRYQSRPLSAKPNTPAAATLEETTLELADGQSPLLRAALVRDVTTLPTRTLAGSIAVGDRARSASAPPASGIQLAVDLPHFDADAWEDLLTSPPPQSAETIELAATLATALPNQVNLHTPRLTAGGRDWRDVRLQTTRQGTNWRGQVQARELAGQFSYRPGAEGKGAYLQAKLGHVKWQTTSPAAPTSTALAAGTPLPAPAKPLPTMPALDIEVGALELDGRQLGTLNLQATHRAHAQGGADWHLNQLTLKVPEAQLVGSGDWASASTSPSGGTPGTRHTGLQFTLDVNDTGALLARFGMPDVFRGGKGQMKGQLNWQGPPYALHTPSLSGQLNLNLATGQFLRADPGIAKLLGVLSLQSLPRRLTLDFSDVFTQGFAFDFVRGDAVVSKGVATTNNLQMKGPTAAVLLEGTADIGTETQDIRALVIPELNAGTASLIATVVNPAVGLGTFLAQAFLRQPLIKASTQTFHIHGSWSDPQVDRVRTASDETPLPIARTPESSATPLPSASPSSPSVSPEKQP